MIVMICSVITNFYTHRETIQTEIKVAADCTANTQHIRDVFLTIVTVEEGSFRFCLWRIVFKYFQCFGKFFLAEIRQICTKNASTYRICARAGSRCTLDSVCTGAGVPLETGAGEYPSTAVLSSLPKAQCLFALLSNSRSPMPSSSLECLHGVSMEIHTCTASSSYSGP